MDLNAYRAFVLAVEHGTITDAAEVLGLSRPTVSRQLSALEDRLGVALLHRTTRAVRPTPRGATLYAELRPLIDGVVGVEQRLEHERAEPSGWLRVSVPPVIAVDIYATFAQLQADHPGLSVELVADVRRADLVAERIDVAVRAGGVGDPSLVQRKLGTRRVYAVASPDYLGRHGMPTSIEALAEHRLLRSHDAEGHPLTSWPTRGGGRVAVDGPFVCNDPRVLLRAALDGAGIALLSDVSARPHVESGRLCEVLPERIGVRLMLHAVFARRTLQPAAVRACIDALVAWADAGGAARLGEDPSGSQPVAG